jgi:hypothetical protein
MDTKTPKAHGGGYRVQAAPMGCPLEPITILTESWSEALQFAAWLYATGRATGFIVTSMASGRQVPLRLA